MSKSSISPEVTMPLLEEEKPQEFKFDIASSMLESLGVNMYTSIGTPVVINLLWTRDATKQTLS